VPDAYYQRITVKIWFTGGETDGAKSGVLDGRPLSRRKQRKLGRVRGHPRLKRKKNFGEKKGWVGGNRAAEKMPERRFAVEGKKY